MEITNIQDILALIYNTINTNETKAPSVPSPLILTGTNLRSGLSAREITKEIISRKAEIGVPIGNLPDGSENIDDKMIYIIVDTILKRLLQDAKITIVIPPGVPVSSTGTSVVGGPVVTQGVTTSQAVGYGIIQ